MVCVWQAVCIENSCLVRGSKEGSNGALHLMAEFMKPAESSMYKILNDNGNFKYVNKSLEASIVMSVCVHFVMNELTKVYDADFFG